MADDSDEDRTEPASGRRIEQAREDGNVPQSRDLGAFLVLLCGVVTLWMLSDWLVLRAEKLMRQGLTLDRKSAFDPRAMLDMLYELSADALMAMAPFYAVILIASVVGPLAMGGLNFTTKSFTPDLMRLNPLTGIGRIFSMHGVHELLKSLLKTALIGGVCYWVLLRQHEQVLGLSAQALEPAMASYGDLVLQSALLLVASLALVAAIDVPFQLWQYYSKLRMTKEELKQEYKEQEGDPMLKGRIRQMQRQMAQRRMMSEVPQANVVVTNPTRYAVALRYREGQDDAPVLVAKGINFVAQSIRELATEHGIPIVEAPPLARALYKHVDLEQRVPPTLFVAVAEVLAYVFRLNEWLRGQGDRPDLPAELQVPPDMDPGADE